MNQTFSISRFYKYANFNIRTNNRLLLILIGGTSVALFLITLFLILTNIRWRESDWKVLFYFTYAISGLLLIGHAFPYLRKKESRMSILILPASNLEKFTFEFVAKFIMFSALFAILFPVVSGLAVLAAESISGRTISGFKFSLLPIVEKDGLSTVLTLGFLFAFSIAFAGAAAIRKLPLLKTLVFVGAVIASGTAYLYTIFEKFDLDYGVGYIVEKIIKTEQQAFTVLYVILIFSSIIALIYAFFKFKEKEA